MHTSCHPQCRTMEIQLATGHGIGDHVHAHWQHYMQHLQAHSLQQLNNEL